MHLSATAAARTDVAMIAWMWGFVRSGANDSVQRRGRRGPRASGLPLTRLLRQSGGQVKIHSEFGRGTTMRLYLPRYTGAMEATPSGEIASGVQQGGSETVLVVDDEPTLVMLISDVPGEYGYQGAVGQERGGGAEAASSPTRPESSGPG
jgi:hypothetical protein